MPTCPYCQNRYDDGPGPCPSCANIIYPDWDIRFIEKRFPARTEETYRVQRLVAGVWINIKTK